MMVSQYVVISVETGMTIGSPSGLFANASFMYYAFRFFFSEQCRMHRLGLTRHVMHVILPLAETIDQSSVLIKFYGTVL